MTIRGFRSRDVPVAAASLAAVLLLLLQGAGRAESLGNPPAWDSGKYALTEELRSKKEYKNIEDIAKNIDDVYVIDLREQKDLKEIPPVILECKRLQKLSIWRSPISTLPKELFQLRNLQILSLKETGLMEIPPEIGWLENLEELHLSENQLTSIPPEIARCKKLKELILYKNQLTGLPDTMVHLENLKRLILSENKLQSLPELPALTSFSIEKNTKLKSLPANFDKSNLYEMSFHECSSLDMEDAFTKLSKHPNLQKLWFWNVHGDDYSMFSGFPKKFEPLDLPEHLMKDMKLKELNLGYNTITTEELGKIVEVLATMPEFKILELHTVYIEALPDNLAKLTNLTRLNLSQTLITTMPAWLNKLTKLESLRLSGCANLAKLPLISDLTKLESLYLNGLPKLTALPPLNHLTQLERLEVEDCTNLAKLPPIDKLEKLTKIDLDDTKFTKAMVDALKKQFPKATIEWEEKN